jgi:hypothetical protein
VADKLSRALAVLALGRAARKVPDAVVSPLVPPADDESLARLNETMKFVSATARAAQEYGASLRRVLDEALEENQTAHQALGQRITQATTGATAALLHADQLKARLDELGNEMQALEPQMQQTLDTHRKALETELGNLQAGVELALDSLKSLPDPVVRVWAENRTLWTVTAQGKKQKIFTVEKPQKQMGGGGGGSGAVAGHATVTQTTADLSLPWDTARAVILADASAAPITITLPTAADRASHMDITVKRVNVGGSDITVMPPAGQTIDGSGDGIVLNTASLGNTTGLEFTPAAGNWWIT